MNWEDFPRLSTQPIGVQDDGTVVKLYPPGISSRSVNPPLNPPMWNLDPPPLDVSGQLVTIAGTPPTVSMGAGETVSEDEILSHQGYVVFVDTATGDASLIESDGTTTEAPADGTAYPLTVG